ncbi:hypothetical protein STVIR_8181 [Streptomyces viridochromogenes Tue57]|uniref:Uncharacterized protein n=1 Tax=Streptomyces viridochromogenes Tue57 TaxID=1160705 RepID=L8P409_STRVR|nr:hypothetical protein STVIR_8181 [Streptomyces viridochromogenes Tue57]
MSLAETLGEDDPALEQITDFLAIGTPGERRTRQFLRDR